MNTAYHIYEAYVDRRPAPERFHNFDIVKVRGRTFALVPEPYFERQLRVIAQPGGVEVKQTRYVARTDWEDDDRE